MSHFKDDSNSNCYTVVLYCGGKKSINIKAMSKELVKNLHLLEFFPLHFPNYTSRET